VKCVKCRNKASVELRRHNSAFCPPHFIEFFHRQVSRNIKRLNMFNADDNLLLAVSGGKDSLALWDFLLDAGYSVTALHIQLGIGNYSLRSADLTRNFATDRQARLIEFDLERELGVGVPKLSRILNRPACSACGLNKRYFFNKIAQDNGFTVVATGHNLDDEAATLLGNVLRWEKDALSRQSPVLERTHPGLVKKVKPLFSLTELETASYCLTKRIAYIEEECPNAKGAHSLLYKDILNQIESRSPGSKQQFFQGFLDRLRPLFLNRESVTLQECVSCGQPTTNTVCSFCRVRERARTAIDSSYTKRDGSIRQATREPQP